MGKVVGIKNRSNRTRAKNRRIILKKECKKIISYIMIFISIVSFSGCGVQSSIQDNPPSEVQDNMDKTQNKAQDGVEYTTYEIQQQVQNEEVKQQNFIDGANQEENNAKMIQQQNETEEGKIEFTSTKQNTTSSSKKTSYRSVAYYTSWSAYDRNVLISQIDGSFLTHLNFAFANLNADGKIIVGDSWVDIEKSFDSNTSNSNGVKGHFAQIKKLKKKYPHLKVLISVGGWTWSTNFSDVAKSKKKRETFAKSAVEFCKKYGFDGVDIDWEFPVEGGNNIKHITSDKENYTKLLQATRKAFDAEEKKTKKTYLLSIAGGPNISFTKNTEIKKIMKYVDFINIMAYDYHGGWESTTNHNAPLYLNKKDPSASSKLSIDETVKAYIKAGAKPEKLNLGLAFYGRAWTNVSSGNQKLKGLFQSGTVPTGTGFGVGTWEAGVFDYWDLKKNYIGKKGYKRYYDTEAKVPYLYNGKTFISYDDKDSITEKMKYMKKQKLGGFMFWEFSGDKNKELQKTAAKYLGIQKKTSTTTSTKKTTSDNQTTSNNQTTEEKKTQTTQKEKNETVKEETAQKEESEKVATWNKTSVYTAGDIVRYKQKNYKAKWWTQGEIPDATKEWGAWELVE